MLAAKSLAEPGEQCLLHSAREISVQIPSQQGREAVSQANPSCMAVATTRTNCVCVKVTGKRTIHLTLLEEEDNTELDKMHTIKVIPLEVLNPIALHRALLRKWIGLLNLSTHLVSRPLSVTFEGNMYLDA